MYLQDVLIEKFRSWRPSEPIVKSKTKYSVTLDWAQGEPFSFLGDQILYRIEKNNKIPPWIIAYSGGKTTKEIDNLAPRHPHKFRLKVILKATAVATLAERAIEFYGNEKNVLNKIGIIDKNTDAIKSNIGKINENISRDIGNSDIIETSSKNPEDLTIDETDERNVREIRSKVSISSVQRVQSKALDHPWLESEWSEETWTNTDTDGTSIICFCMAVRCGYIKQVQGMLDERPELIGVINTSNGFTPLATAVRKGDINIVRFLLMAGADVNQPCSTGQTALHLALFARHLPIMDLLLDKGADFQARDLNGLRAEHYAVDCGDLTVLRYVLDKGGDITVQDNNGWTPLFRALCQGANTEIVEDLVVRGSDINAVDKAGLPLTSIARLLTSRLGRNRDSILRLVDVNYPHEKALANFTRLTKKIYNVHTLLKMPGLTAKANLRN